MLFAFTVCLSVSFLIFLTVSIVHDSMYNSTKRTVISMTARAVSEAALAVKLMLRSIPQQNMWTTAANQHKTERIFMNDRKNTLYHR